MSIDPSENFPNLDVSAMEAAAESLLARAATEPSPKPPRGGGTRRVDDGGGVKEAGVVKEAPFESPVMWGRCSVGPVLKGRLVAQGLQRPLPIQEASFAPIASGENTLISSQTGSGD